MSALISEISHRPTRKLVLETQEDLLAFNDFLREIGIPEADLIISLGENNAD